MKISDGDQGEFIEGGLIDVVRFDISGEKDKFILFGTSYNCWTSCQKNDFVDKKQQIVFNMKVHNGENDHQITSKFLNIQKNPGRGSGLVKPKTQENWMDFCRMQRELVRNEPNIKFGESRRQGNHTLKSVLVEVNVMLDPVYEFRSGIEMAGYLNQMAFDLSVHAQTLHNRDISNLVRARTMLKADALVKMDENESQIDQHNLKRPHNDEVFDISLHENEPGPSHRPPKMERPDDLNGNPIPNRAHGNPNANRTQVILINGRYRIIIFLRVRMSIQTGQTKILDQRCGFS